jgi:hypothetical protein
MPTHSNESPPLSVSVSGKRDFAGQRQRRPKGPSHSTDVSRDKGPARKPTNSALFARHREISVCMGLRGGVGRTRTSNQAVICKEMTKGLARSAPTAWAVIAFSD